jgi:dipeptidyl aminopeptidase/acylaminoacyl peptidase
VARRSALTVRRFRRLWALSVLLAAGLAPTATATQQGAGEMREFFRSRWVYQPTWSPDGMRVAYLEDDWSTQDIYVAELGSGGPPRKMSRSSRFIGNPRGGSAGQPPVWSPDGTELLYAQDGALKIVGIAQGQVRDFGTPGEPRSGGTYSPDGSKILFSSKGRLQLFDRAAAATRTVAPSESRSLSGALWSPDGKRLAVSANTPGQAFTLIPPYVGRLLSFPFSQPGTSELGTLNLQSGAFEPLPPTSGSQSAIAWSPDGRSLLVERTTPTFKQRSLAIVDVTTSAVQVIAEDRDDRYLPLARGFAVYTSDGGSIVFSSERSGWNHLYAYELRSGQTRALTTGTFEVREVAEGADGWIYYTSSESGAAQPQVYRVRPNSGSRVQLTKVPAVHSAVSPHPRGTHVLYMRSDPKSLPDLWIQPIAAGTPTRVTSSNPPPGITAQWQEPKLVTFPGHDGLEVKGQLFMPPHTGPSARPAIVHVHQASSYQDVFFGPGPQKDNIAWYAWHQRLAQLGYVVLNVDYRGSTGYGRDYRTANYRDLGGGDHLDAVYGVRYLQTLGVVDVNRVGIYGMSYGGHLVLSALTKSPRVFKAGIDIAGVADMRMVYDTAGRGAVVSRLGTPEASPELYRSASAISFVDDLQSPVMILHGTDDPNVSILQSLQLIDALLARGKRFEFEAYPGELHFFTRSRSWIDAFTKMERFFGQELGIDSSRRE